MNPVVRGGVCHGCTAAQTVITVELSTVSRWYPPVGAVGEPESTTQSAAATHTSSSTNFRVDPISLGVLSTTQGSGVSPSDPLPLGLEFPMNPVNSDPSDPYNLIYNPPASSFTSGVAEGLYENDMQSFPFNPSATLGSTSSTFIPPSSSSIFDLHHARTDFTAATAAAQSSNPSLLSTSRKRGRPPVPAQDERRKHRKLETRDKRIVDQQVGAHQAVHRSITVTNNAQAVEVDASPVPIFDRPQGMPRGEYVKLLRAAIAAECDAPANNE